MSRTIGSYSHPEQFRRAFKFYEAKSGDVGATLIHRHLMDTFGNAAVVEKTVSRWMPAIKAKATRMDGLWRWPTMPEGVPVEASRLLMDCRLEYDGGEDVDPKPEDYSRLTHLIFSNRMAKWAYYCHQIDPTWWPSDNPSFVNELGIMAEDLSDAELSRDIKQTPADRTEEMWMTMLEYRPHLNTPASSIFYERMRQGSFDFDTDLAITITVRRDKLLNPITYEGAESEWWVRRYRADKAWKNKQYRKLLGKLIRLQSRESWNKQLEDDPELASKIGISVEELSGYLNEREEQ